jgi:ribosomal protein L11 methyltransferase
VRSFPALDVAWATRPSDDIVERLLAEIDDDEPTAVEERPGGIRVFFAAPDRRARAAVRVIAADPSVECTPVDVPDEDWAERSQASLGSVRVGRIVIAVTPRDEGGPSSGAANQAQDGDTTTPDVVLTIAPSMGFGTGHHASTRLCLRLMQHVPLPGARVLDVGTGSGVLALAAWRLGAAEVIAIDRDPDALAAASQNVDRNGRGSALTLAEADFDRAADRFAGRFDVVLANLTGDALVRQARGLARAVAGLGHLVASGFHADETASVTAACQAAGFEVAEYADEDGWVGIWCILPAPDRPERAQ